MAALRCLSCRLKDSINIDMGITFEQKQPMVMIQLQRSYQQGTIAHAYLFEGEVGTGKKETAIWLAQLLFCQNIQNDAPCNTCHNCLRIKANEHPDVQQIKPDGQTIKVQQIRDLKTEFSKSGVETKKKVFIIESAEKMSAGAANSLLKFLEEPDGQMMAILLTEGKARILPTIQSRCQILHFSNLSRDQFIKELENKGVSQKKAEYLSHLTGDLEKAVEISQDEWFNEAREATDKWFTQLLNKDFQAFVYVQKKVCKVFKEKEQQLLALDLLMLSYQRHFEMLIGGLAVKKDNSYLIQKSVAEIEIIFNGKRKLEANVSFQNVCEQMVWLLLKDR